MKALRYGNRKCSDIYWDISTPEKEDAACRALFKLLKEDWQAYNGLKEYHDFDRRVNELKELEKSLNAGEVPVALKEDAERKLRDLPSLEQHVRDFKKQSELYEKAELGNLPALKKLLQLRKTYEYEEWDVVEVINPLE